MPSCAASTRLAEALRGCTDEDEPIDVSFVSALEDALEKASCVPKRFSDHVSSATASSLLIRLSKSLQTESTVVQIDPPDSATVVVVGDLHGQLSDLRQILSEHGRPCARTVLYVFNGDYVDRGAHSLEVLLMLAALKLSAPSAVWMTRGNHESRVCNKSYGFRDELTKKLGARHSKSVYFAAEELFMALPLAARVGRHTIVLHGGLFRAPGTSLQDATPGTVQQLAACPKGGPNGDSDAMVCDVLWSDPQGPEGMAESRLRGRGMLFGPDVTRSFLSSNRLRLVIRSHEDPDCRFTRCGKDGSLPMLWQGYSVDHDCGPEVGQLVTVYSCPVAPKDDVRPTLHGEDEVQPRGGGGGKGGGGDELQPTKGGGGGGTIGLGAVALLTRERGEFSEPEFRTFKGA